MTRLAMLAFAEGLVSDAAEQRERILVEQPSREPLARAVVDETVRVYFLIESCRKIGKARELEIKARLVKADLMTQALLSPVQ